MHVNYRFAPSRSGEPTLSPTCTSCSPDSVEIVVADVAEGARPGLDAPLAQAFVAAVGGTRQPKYGWTDVARFSALGIPAVNYGPGDPSLAHADDERVPLAQIERVETGLRRWLTAAARPTEPRLRGCAGGSPRGGGACCWSTSPRASSRASSCW